MPTSRPIEVVYRRQLPDASSPHIGTARRWRSRVSAGAAAHYWGNCPTSGLRGTEGSNPSPSSGESVCGLET